MGRPRCAVTDAQAPEGRGASDRDGRGGRGRPDLVEAGAAVDRPVVARSKRDHGLATTAAADGGMELARSADGSGALGDSPTGRTSLGVVEQPLAREERLLTAGEDELACAIAANEATVLEHACLFLLYGAFAPVCSRPPARVGRTVGADRRCAPTGRAGLGPGTQKGTITLASSTKCRRISRMSSRFATNITEFGEAPGF